LVDEKLVNKLSVDKKSVDELMWRPRYIKRHLEGLRHFHEVFLIRGAVNFGQREASGDARFHGLVVIEAGGCHVVAREAAVLAHEFLAF
jgi:hypothetical protein